MKVNFSIVLPPWKECVTMVSYAIVTRFQDNAIRLVVRHTNLKDIVYSLAQYVAMLILGFGSVKC